MIVSNKLNCPICGNNLTHSNGLNDSNGFYLCFNYKFYFESINGVLEGISFDHLSKDRQDKILIYKSMQMKSSEESVMMYG